MIEREKKGKQLIIIISIGSFQLNSIKVFYLFVFMIYCTSVALRNNIDSFSPKTKSPLSLIK